MVEARGVEPLSESPFTQTSPGAECCLKFPNRADSIQTALSGIFLLQRRYGKSSRRSFTASRRPYQSRGTQCKDGCLIKQQKQIYCCLHLNLSFVSFATLPTFPGLNSHMQLVATRLHSTYIKYFHHH